MYGNVHTPQLWSRIQKRFENYKAVETRLSTRSQVQAADWVSAGSHRWFSTPKSVHSWHRGGTRPRPHPGSSWGRERLA
eukprot:scaffold31553_cov63-Phaeocystis_antarctica.AAC.5